MTIDPTKVSFSQAQGYESLPQPLQLEELDRRSRVNIWNVFYETFVDPDDENEIDEDELGRLIYSLHIDFFEGALDEAPAIYSSWSYFIPYILS